ncbi:glutathione S-transferase [Acrasis kona]|uniref:Glutathione S-transferase n=1 Tax=Acrasis kona TaxID=1008807 RepID=A0AAW2ZN57_9EUKA
MSAKRDLYELVDKRGNSISPFVFRVKAVLGYKDLEYKTIQLTFQDIQTQIPSILPLGKKEVPILVEDTIPIQDSAAIYKHLELNYPNKPIPEGPIKNFNEGELFMAGIPLSVNIVNVVADQDVDYVESKINNLTKRSSKDCLEPAIYNEGVRRWREKCKEISELLKDHGDEVTYTLITLASIVHWVSSIAGEENTFGDNEFLKNWFTEFKKKVNVK